jgi:hypothetical protein
MLYTIYNTLRKGPQSGSLGQLGKAPTGVASLSIGQLFNLKQGSSSPGLSQISVVNLSQEYTWWIDVEESLHS